MDVLRSPLLSRGMIWANQRQQNRAVEMAGFNKSDLRQGRIARESKSQPIEKADARHKRDLFPTARGTTVSTTF